MQSVTIQFKEEDLLKLKAKALKAGMVTEHYLHQLCLKDIKPKPQVASTLFTQCMDLYFKFIISRTGIKPVINGVDGKALKNIIKFLHANIHDTSTVTDALEYIFNNWHRLDNYIQNNLKLSQINYNLVNILNQLRNGKQGSAEANRIRQQQIIDNTYR